MHTNKRCDQCNLYACCHIRSAYSIEDGIVSVSDRLSIPIGEHIENAMDNVVPSRVIIPPNPSVSTPIPYENWANCKTCNKTKVHPSADQCFECKNPQYMNSYRDNWDRTFKAHNKPEPQPTKELQKINMQTDWVNCNICRSHVKVAYLDKHLKVHALTFEPTNTTQTTSTALVRVSDDVVPTPITYKKTEETSKPSLRPTEHYKFRKLEQACFASSTSHDGRYSDFTIIFWEREKPTVQSAVYSGGSTSYVSKDWERFLIHVVYDSREHYYTLTSKLLKRGEYSSWDTEDANPDRICDQEELQTEIKRALLFYRINPKFAYRLFRKLCKQPIDITYNDDRLAIIAQSDNCQMLQDKLKQKPYSHTGSGHNHGHYDYHGI